VAGLGFSAFAARIAPRNGSLDAQERPQSARPADIFPNIAGKGPLQRTTKIHATACRGLHVQAGADQCLRSSAAECQERESSESPMLNAFCRVAPSVLRSFLAIAAARDFLRAIVLSSRTSLEVHARRLFFLFAIKPPFQESQLVSLTGANEKPTDG